MNFKRFAVATTNIFPLANSTAGGQLLTEYNLRSRESVDTDPSVKYMIGPSYTHSEDDFYVRVQQSDDGVKISSSTLEILPGRALVNGHFVESLAPILIDLSAANASRDKGQAALKGELSVGLKVMYSTKATIAGSMLVENDENVYEGIQVVVLPTSEFLTPSSNSSTQTDESVVTAHLKLADFIYLNGKIINVVQNPNRSKTLSADRIGDVDKLLSDIYVTKTGLNTRNHHYVFSSKSTGDDVKDTWCPADESLMVWDSSPSEQNLTDAEYRAVLGKSIDAHFSPSSDGVELVIPHKQIDTSKDTSGKHKYMLPKRLSLPIADYGSENAGVVNAEYTKHIKQLRSELNNIYSTHSGKQRGYIASLTERSSLPPIGTTWNIGDYILIGNDSTLNESATQNIGVTVSTMYAVLPGIVSKIGVRLDSKTDAPPGVRVDYKESSDEPNTKDSDIYNQYWSIGTSSVSYRGTPGEDYFQYRWIKEDGSYQDYYYTVFTAGAREYSDPIFVTGQVALAEAEKVGGFYNVTESDLDAGYVYLDETGHLRLLDYTLLRSGTLAYQLGEDWDSGDGLTLNAIQEELDDKVNQRVAFKTISQSSAIHNVVHLYIRLNVTDTEDEESTNYLTIRDIDSRFNTSVYLHVVNDCSKPVYINIINCQKIRIDNNIPNNVHFNISGSCVYYDAQVLDNAMSIDGSIENLSMWYEQFYEDDGSGNYTTSDPNLIVDGMTIRCAKTASITNEINYWDESNPNDMHYKYALDSITFGKDGKIIGLGLVFQNDCTDNIELGSRIIVDAFDLPSSNQLPYPINAAQNKIKVAGSFVTAYPTTEKDDMGKGYIVYDSNVNVLTNAHDLTSDDYTISGTLSIFVKSEFVRNFVGIEFGNNIDGWDTDAYHKLSGGAI